MSTVTTVALTDMPPEVEDHIMQRMDIPSLLSFRGTRHRSYVRATAQLQQLLQKIVAHYLGDHTTVFMTLLYDQHALIWGNAALAFFLRDTSLLDKDLDVAVGPAQEGPFRALLRIHLGDHLVYLWTRPRRQHRAGEEIHVHCYWLARRRRYLRVHCAQRGTALLPIIRASSTLWMNYVNPISFGCLFPGLTLQRSGMIQKPWLVRPWDRRRAIILISRGFRFAYHSRNLLPAPGVPPITLAPGGGCLEAIYLCPHQTRYFGDPGSLLSFFDSAMPLEWFQRTGMMPFGQNIVFRWSRDTRDCNSVCVRGDRHFGFYGGDQSLIVLPVQALHYGPRFQGMTFMYR